MPTYPFLSDEWLAEVERLTADDPTADDIAEVTRSVDDVVVNVTVTGTPFGDDRQLHLGAQEGAPRWGHGHAEVADLAMVTDYATARELFLEGDPQAVMQAFLLGKLVVTGDLAKLVERAQTTGTAWPTTPELVARLHAITE